MGCRLTRSVEPLAPGVAERTLRVVRDGVDLKLSSVGYYKIISPFDGSAVRAMNRVGSHRCERRKAFEHCA